MTGAGPAAAPHCATTAGSPRPSSTAGAATAGSTTSRPPSSTGGSRLPEWIERRREIARSYTRLLSDLPELEIPIGPDDDPQRRDVYQNYVVTTDWRDPLAEQLRDDGIETMVSWPIPLHRKPGLGLGHHRLPRTEALGDRVLSLPMYPELGDDQVEHVATSVRRFFER